MSNVSNVATPADHADVSKTSVAVPGRGAKGRITSPLLKRIQVLEEDNARLKRELAEARPSVGTKTMIPVLDSISGKISEVRACIHGGVYGKCQMIGCRVG